jgi:hypothetical protein
MTMSSDTEDITERAPSLDRSGRAAYRVESNGWDVSTTIVKAVAKVTDCELLAGEPLLYDVVDPDALERLFSDRRGGSSLTNGKVVFELRGCRVEVHADGDPVVYEPVEDPGESPTSTAKSA